MPAPGPLGPLRQVARNYRKGKAGMLHAAKDRERARARPQAGKRSLSAGEQGQSHAVSATPPCCAAAASVRKRGTCPMIRCRAPDGYLTQLIGWCLVALNKQQNR